MKAIYYKNSLRTEIIQINEVSDREQAHAIFSKLADVYPCIVYEMVNGLDEIAFGTLHQFKEQSIDRYISSENKIKHMTDDLPIHYAFGNEQFAKAMAKLGLTENDQDRIQFIGNGAFVLKEDYQYIVDAFQKKAQARRQSFEDDASGEGYTKDAFLYAMQNTEYAYASDENQLLEYIGLKAKDLENPTIKHGFDLALQIYNQTF